MRWRISRKRSAARKASGDISLTERRDEQRRRVGTNGVEGDAERGEGVRDQEGEISRTSESSPESNPRLAKTDMTENAAEDKGQHQRGEGTRRSSDTESDGTGRWLGLGELNETLSSVTKGVPERFKRY